MANNLGAIWLSGSSNNRIIRNNITENTWEGILLFYSSNNNSLNGNTITGNGYYGIVVSDSSNNIIFHNNIINNLVLSSDSVNLWDAGYPSGGNYWSHYNGTDVYRGKYQNETGNLYNLEATPAESTSYRLARLDKKMYPNIITSGKDEPYITNSTQLPVDYSDNVIEALEHQNDIQPFR